MGGVLEAVAAGGEQGKKGSSCETLSISLKGCPPRLSLNSCSDRELLLHQAICSSVTSVEKFSLLLSKRCWRFSELCLLEQQSNLTLLYKNTSSIRRVIVTHVRFVFPYKIILVPSAISPYHVTQLDTLQPPDVSLKTWCPELNSMFQRASDQCEL